MDEKENTFAKLKTGANGSLRRWVKARSTEIGCCPLCTRVFGTGTGEVEPVGDHCHASGVMRDVLCRNCNGREGAVKDRPTRFPKETNGVTFTQWLRNLADYLELHTTPQTNYIHPTHLNEAEKAKQTRRKRALSQAKRRAARKGGII